MKYDDIIERLKIMVRLSETCDDHPDCEGCDRIEECANFTNEMASETCNSAIDAITDLRKTVYDLLVRKSPEELAEWIAEVLSYCSNSVCDEKCPMYECCCCQSSDNIEDWLKQEAKNGEID